MKGYLKILILLICLYLVVRLIEIGMPLFSAIHWENLNWGTIADYLMLIMTIITIVLATKEYRSAKQREKYAVFSEYSKRYSEDENIKATSEFIIAYLNGEKLPDLTINQKEMFLRFFEELEMQIEKGRMDKEVVEDFFVYYAVAAAMCPPFLQGTELINGKDRMDLWQRYRKLIKRYESMEQGVVMDYLRNHTGSNEPKIEIVLPDEKCCCNSFLKKIGIIND